MSFFLTLITPQATLTPGHLESALRYLENQGITLAGTPVWLAAHRAADLPLRAGCRRMPDIESALHAACATGKQVFVIGGASIYAAAWPYCRYFYLTRIEADFAGDTLLPAAIPLADWGLVQERQARYLERISGQSVNCRFQVYEQGNPRVLPGRVYG